MWRGWKQAISLYKNDILLPNRIAGIGGWRERFVSVDIHILSCQRINKGHSFISFQVATLVSFPQPPPLPEIGRREVLIIYIYIYIYILPISSRARNEQLNLGLPCGLWITVHSANRQGTKADNNKKKRLFLFSVYPSGYCLPYHWRGSYHLVPFGNHTGCILWFPISNCPVVEWGCQPGARGLI